MGLQDWTIHVVWRPACSDHYAAIIFDRLHQTATIEMNRPRPGDPDIDRILVHELLHLILDPLDDAGDDEDNDALEIVINKLSKILTRKNKNA